MNPEESRQSFFARLRSRDPLWSVYPTSRFGWAVLATGALWLVPRVGLSAGAAGVLLLIVAAAFDYWRLPGMRHITVERRVPEIVGLGDEHILSYEIRSFWPWRVTTSLFDEMPPGLDAAIPSDPIQLAARESRVLDVAVIATSRRKKAFGTLAIRSTTPLGLLARLTRISAPQSMVVVPSLTNVRRFRLLALQHRLSDVGVRALRLRGEGTALAGVREYVQGDDPRLVDWKSTARHARLIVREQAIERSQTVMCMIDCGRAMTQLAGAYPRFEHVLSSALVLSDVAAASGDRVGLIAFDDSVRAYIAPQKGSAALRALRTTLTSLDATMSEPDYASAFRMLAMRQRRRALIVFFTDVVESRMARSFAAFASRSVQRHLLVVVAIQNAELLAAARPNTASALALFRSAAAEELVREREEALARMRHAGVSVLDVSSEHMAAAVVNRYLDVKARGLL